MKHSYRFILPAVLLSSVFSVAQQAPAATPVAAPAAPTPAAQPVTQPAATTPAPATAPAAQPATQPAVGPAPQPEQAASAPQPDAATQAPAPQPEVAPAPQPVAAPAQQSAAQPAPASATPAPAVQPSQTTETAVPAAVATAQSAPDAKPIPVAEAPAVDSTASASTDSTVSSAAAPVAEPAAEPIAEAVAIGTEIKGSLHGLLTAELSPYVVVGNITIEPNTALLIQQGVVLQFQPGTGLIVNNGQIMAAGSAKSPIVFKAAPGGEWKGITITGNEQASFRNVDISGAEVGIAVENGNISLQSSTISKTSGRGLYVRNGKASVMDCEFTDNKGAAIHASNYATVEVERTKMSNNNIALLNSELANTTVSSSNMSNNNYGVMAKQNNMFNFHDTKVSDNKVGAAAFDVFDESVIESVKGNQKDFDSEALAAMSALPANPEIPGAEVRPLNPNDKIGVLIREQEIDNAIATVSAKTGWNILGNVMLGGKYHFVMTRKNHGENEVVNGDTVKTGERYNNTFQVPGFGGEASAFLLMQSNDGKTIEFNADITSDSWNHFSPNPVTLKYNDEHNHLTLGDMQKTAGTIYMSGLPLFGVDYSLAVLKNNDDQDFFTFSGFFGEAVRPMVPGSRHPDIYKNYIEDGTAQAQRLAYGGSIKWAPVRRFDATVGAIYAYDEIKYPLLRDGSGAETITADPMLSAFTVYADGNWLFFPGDIELNGQIALGRADTTDVIRQRAINKVFEGANLETASYNTLRKLMQNSSRIDYMKHDDLVEIFGETTGLRDQEMKDSLRTLIKQAKKVQSKEEDKRDQDRILGLDWGSQNAALAASLDWNIYKTRLSGHVKYVGEDFYSAGSPNQLADTREFGGRLEQDILSFWTFGFDYQINIENAAKDKNYNLFGLGEGSFWGVSTDKEDSWFDEHELDRDRTKYIQKIGTDQTFNINKNIELVLGYNLLFQKQYRHFQLHGDYLLEDNIYRDDWFKPIEGKAVDMVIRNGDTTYINALRWEKYNNLVTEPYLASKFQERIFKHTWNAGVTVKAMQSIFKVNGRWTLRNDDSKFYKDDAIKGMDLADTTWAKLGYYFHGGDYFEQTYPVVVTTTLKSMQNRFEVTPRFKSYVRDEMSESEITVADEIEIPFMNRFLILGINGEFRYMTTDWESGDEEFNESETDVLSALNLRINHTKHFYSEWYTGTAFYYHPDDLASQYKDIYAGINLNYVF